MRWPEACTYCESPKPGSLDALMELYEQNYMRLRCLCPQLRNLTGNHVSRVAEAHDLMLKIVDQTRHTTTLKLTYEMSDGDHRPDSLIRLCHDSVQAEVITQKCRLNQDWLTPTRVDVNSALICRWKLNRFLYKWLNYVHRQGHQFDDSQLAGNCGDLSSIANRGLVDIL